MYICVEGVGGMCRYEHRWPWNPEDGIPSPGAGITDDGELFGMGSRNQINLES